MEGWKDEWMDTDEWMDRWIDGWLRWDGSSGMEWVGMEWING